MKWRRKAKKKRNQPPPLYKSMMLDSSNNNNSIHIMGCDSLIHDILSYVLSLVFGMRFGCLLCAWNVTSCDGQLFFFSMINLACFLSLFSCLLLFDLFQFISWPTQALYTSASIPLLLPNCLNWETPSKTPRPYVNWPKTCLFCWATRPPVGYHWVMANPT